MTAKDWVILLLILSMFVLCILCGGLAHRVTNLETRADEMEDAIESIDNDLMEIWDELDRLEEVYHECVDR